VVRLEGEEWEALHVRWVVEQLPEVERRVLLRYAEGWRCKEIAAAEGRSVAWVRQVLRRAVARARELGRIDE